MDIKEKEIEMWEAAKYRDRVKFLELVCPDAVMICGGFRCSGLEYSYIIRDFDLADYIISDFEVVHETEDTWKKINEDWKLIFNMDSRL